MVFGKRALPVVVLVVVISMIGMSQASATVPPVKVLGGRTDQFSPGANASWLGWTANSLAQRDHYDAFVRRISDQTTYQLNATKQALFGGITPDTDEAIIQQYNNRGSNLHVFDLSGVGDPVKETDPANLNTSGWESFPAISAGWILYLVQAARSESLRLYNRGTFASHRLDGIRYADGNILPGTVTDQYATWTRCTRVCNVFYYDVVGEVLHKVSNPNDRFYYAPSTSDATNLLYFVRSGRSCGSHVRIMRWQIGSPTAPVTVSSLPLGYDVALRTFTFYDGQDNVFFDRLHCGGRYYSDIYELPAADTG